jgi:hypothetical protein
MKKELPIYQIIVDESLEADSEVSAVALVDFPAIQRDFLSFKDDSKVSFNVKFAATQEEERKVFGPLMIADMPIYRVLDGEEFYVVFSKETIDRMAQKFHQKGFQKSVNLMHDPEQSVEGVTMFQSWIVDRNLGIMPMKGYEDAPDGSWFGGFKVNNEDVWNKIKSGDVRGFSIEGVFGMKKVKMGADEIVAKLK